MSQLSDEKKPASEPKIKPELASLKKAADAFPTFVPNFQAAYEDLVKGELRDGKTAALRFQTENVAPLKKKIIEAFESKAEYEGLRRTVQTNSGYPVEKKQEKFFINPVKELTEKRALAKELEGVKVDANHTVGDVKFAKGRLKVLQQEITEEAQQLAEAQGPSRLRAFVAEMSREGVWAEDLFLEVGAKELFGVGVGVRLNQVSTFQNEFPIELVSGEENKPIIVIENSHSYRKDGRASDHFEFKGIRLNGQFYPASDPADLVSHKKRETQGNGDCAWNCLLLAMAKIKEISNGLQPQPPQPAAAAANQSYAQISQQLNPPAPKSQPSPKTPAVAVDELELATIMSLSELSLPESAHQQAQGSQSFKPGLQKKSPQIPEQKPLQDQQPQQPIPERQVTAKQLTLDEKNRALEHLLGQDVYDEFTPAQVEQLANDPSWQDDIRIAHETLAAQPQALPNTAAIPAPAASVPQPPLAAVESQRHASVPHPVDDVAIEPDFDLADLDLHAAIEASLRTHGAEERQRSELNAVIAASKEDQQSTFFKNIKELESDSRKLSEELGLNEEELQIVMKDRISKINEELDEENVFGPVLSRR